MPTTTTIVRNGDTLSGILRARGVPETQLPREVARVATMNSLSNPDLIRPGQRLVLPDTFDGRAAGESPALGAGAAPGPASSVVGTMLSTRSAPTIAGATVRDGELFADTAVGEINLGSLDAAGSRGDFWISPDRQSLVFAKSTGGGFENENQSLFILNGQDGTVASVLSEKDRVAMFSDVKFTSLPDGRKIALATEADGGLGAGDVHVVDLAKARTIGREPGSLKALVPTPRGVMLKLEVLNDGGEPSPRKVALDDVVSRGVPGIREAQKASDGTLTVAVGGETIALGNLDQGSSRGNFWPSPDGTSIVYSLNTGGGYENENQTLYVFDARTRNVSALLGPERNVAAFDSVRFAPAPNGHLCTVASEADGGLGAGRTHVVDLTNGDVLGQVPGFMEDGPGIPAFSQKGFETKIHTRIITPDGERTAVHDLTPILAAARTTIDM